MTEEFGYCENHGDSVNEGTYLWKGCWGCLHFKEGEYFSYVFVPQASERLGVSESTIRRWIKKGKLEGELFEQGRYTSSLPSPKKYHIWEKSVEKLKKELETKELDSKTLKTAR